MLEIVCPECKGEGQCIQYYSKVIGYIMASCKVCSNTGSIFVSKALYEQMAEEEENGNYPRLVGE